MSFLNQLQLIYEREDYKFGNKISVMVDKINKFLTKYSEHLESVALARDDNGSYWYSVDPSMDDRRLFLVLAPEDTGEHARSIATFTKGTDKHGKFYGIKLNVLKDPPQFDDKDFGKNLAKETIIQRSLYHELTHYFDDVRPGYNNPRSNSIDLEQKDVEEINKEIAKYYNLPDELNAYWNEVSIMLLTYLKKEKVPVINDFNKFKETFLTLFNKHGKHFERLTEDNKKRVLKRIYSFWNELKDRNKSKK